MNSPDISVIIPLYRVEEYIEDCLRSVLEQAIPLDIILVDDCGGDQTATIAKQFLEKHANEHTQWQIITHEHNRGLSAARNSALDVARGNYIYFLDSDDILLEGALEGLLNQAKTTNTQLCIGDIRRQVGDPISCQLPPNTLLEGVALREAYLREYFYCMACNKLISRTFILHNNLYFIEGLIHEDETWSMQLAFCMPRTIYYAHETYWYRNARENSITTQTNIPHLQARLLGQLVFLNKTLELGAQARILSEPNYQNRINTICRWALNDIPSFEQFSIKQKLHYYSLVVKHAHPALRQPESLGIDPRMRRIASISSLPSTLSSLITLLYSAFWK